MMHGGMVANLSERLGHLAKAPGAPEGETSGRTVPGSLATPLPCRKETGHLPVRLGYRHFLRDPLPEELCRHTFGLKGEAEDRALRERLGKLARRLTAEWGVDPVLPAENGNLPSGYTYLMQFIAHDLVQTSIPLSSLIGEGTGIENLRHTRLRLDTLYGGGPFVTPTPYAPDQPDDRTRTKLRLGQMAKPPEACPFRDIGRVSADPSSGAKVEGLSEALLADPRNDDHAILSQLTALFHRLHNHIVDCLTPAAPPESGGNGCVDATTASLLRFLCARECVTLIYRHVIRCDLMQRLLHPAVFDAYAGPSPRLYDRSSDAALPLEFCFGAFRFAHAMVRESYLLNTEIPVDSVSIRDALRRSCRNREHLPLDAKWIVQWSHFFPILPDTQPNLSRPLSPSFADALIDENMFRPVDASGTVGLPYYDLLSAAKAGLWSVDALIKELTPVVSDLFAKSELLSDPVRRKQELHEWLEKNNLIPPDDVEGLAADPPLSVYVLFEAAKETCGERLGVLGSILVAEVLYRALDGAPMRWERRDGALTDALRLVVDAVFPEQETARRDWIRNISTMSELVEFTAKARDLQNASPAFV